MHLIVQEQVQFLRYFIHGELIGDAFADDFFTGQDVHECEIADGEEEGLKRSDESDERSAGEMIDGYLRATEESGLECGCS